MSPFILTRWSALILQGDLFLGKTISFTSSPDCLGVLTRSAFAGLAQTKNIIANGNDDASLSDNSWAMIASVNGI